MSNWLDHEFITAVMSEVKRAREKFPSPSHLALAHAEEAGEVTKAVLDFTQKGGSRNAIWKEAVQAAAMALRVACEGDPTVRVPPMTQKDF